jgi:type III pantothenate kinase
MQLCIDIGNTRCKLALFQDSYETYFGVTSNFDQQEIESLFQANNITSTILSTTRKIEDEWIRFLKSKARFLLLDENTKLPIVNKYETPQTLGKDRIAAAVAANYLFPDSHCIIIDAGTCITTDFIDKEGNYLGGNIIPGINMRLKAMHEFTSKLPLVKAEFNKSLFGKNTKDAIQNGGVKGAIYEVGSFIREVSEKYINLKVLLTGGDAHFFVKHLKNEIFAFPNLVLLGLNEILRYNADQ